MPEPGPDKLTPAKWPSQGRALPCIRRRRRVWIVLALLGPALWAHSVFREQGDRVVIGLGARTVIRFDGLGVPTIEAATREDAFLALGFVTARERLFQLEMSRRKAAGRLAEVVGPAALASDRQQRRLGASQLAESIVARLPRDQRRTLDAYTRGINAYLESVHLPALELLLSGVHPEPWTPSDSMLVALSMFQLLTYTEREERMLSVMADALPAELVSFFTPDTDLYSAPLLGGSGSHRPQGPLPVAALRTVRRGSPPLSLGSQGGDEGMRAGSNGWAVGRGRTVDGRAILANDMHLPLAVPNLWYRAVLRYGKRTMAGLSLPGIPLIVVGSSKRIAWGFTNINADVLDLVYLEIDPGHPEGYRTPTGWKPFEVAQERIAVKGEEDAVIEIRRTIWGPVAEAPLLGRPIAIRWSALDPDTVNLDLMNLDHVRDVRDAMRIVNRAGGPHQNVVLADHRGSIAWTYMGKLPQRVGFDGVAAHSWADGTARWEGYIPPRQLPRVVDPPEGFIATANNRMLGPDYPHLIGHNYANDYRAFRITQGLRDMERIDEAALFALQFDTRTAVFDFYRSVALEALRAAGDRAGDRDIRRALEAWDGRAETDSIGFGLLMELRRGLIAALSAAFLSGCYERDPGFEYRWFKIDTPLRQLLLAKDPETLPDADRYPDWDALLVDLLREAAGRLRREHPDRPLYELRWGELSRVTISHPYSAALPFLGGLLDMPRAPLAGCAHCIRVVYDQHGASERMVVSPGHERDGILHMPAGQSGRPWSRHYRDQQEAWLNGAPLSFQSDEVAEVLVLNPAP